MARTRRDLGIAGGACLALALVSHARDARAFEPHLFVVAADGSSTAVGLDEPGWPARVGVEPIAPEPLVVRHALGLHHVVNPTAGTVQVIDPETFETLAVHSVGAGTSPQDVLVVDATKAYVSRRDSASILVMDPSTGDELGTIDLASFADADGLPEMARMARDGTRVFVQLQRVDRVTWEPILPSLLAVVDVTTDALVDVDPATPGTQAIALTSYGPDHDMQVDEAARRLYLMETAGFNGQGRGGIEAIDLDTLAPLGMVLTEDTVGPDCTSFVIVSDDVGYVIAHTDLTPSSHLTRFSPRDGSVQRPELLVTFTDRATLALDRATSTLFFISPDDDAPGVHAFDAVSGTQLTATPIPAGGRPLAGAIARGPGLGEPRDVRVRALDRASGEVTLAFTPACNALDHALLVGRLPLLGGLSYSDQLCGLSTTGSWRGVPPGPASAFYLVVATDGATREGPYGRDAFDRERPESGADAACPLTRDLAARCD